MPFRFKTEHRALIWQLYFVFYYFRCLSFFSFHYSIYENILELYFLNSATFMINFTYAR